MTLNRSLHTRHTNAPHHVMLAHGQRVARSHHHCPLPDGRIPRLPCLRGRRERGARGDCSPMRASYEGRGASASAAARLMLVLGTLGQSCAEGRSSYLAIARGAGGAGAPLGTQ